MILYNLDCRVAMGLFMEENSVDSIVTDPPYGIRFMGKAWDGKDILDRTARRAAMKSHAPKAGPNGGHKSIAAEAGKYDLGLEAMRAFQDFSEEWAREAYRVLKPGGYLLSFASPRTYHRMVSGIEDAGFEIRDCIQWVFGSGFPKSHNLEGDHKGWGTALKPAHEPICVARKPLAKGCTVAMNVERYNTGAMNIDGCRVETSDDLNGGAYAEVGGRSVSGSLHADSGMNVAGKTVGAAFVQPTGRWPANLIHDGSDEVMAAFPQAPGQLADASSSSSRKNQNVYGAMSRGSGGAEARVELDKSAARFFYAAKASKKDRNEGLDHLPVRQAGMVSNTGGQHITRRDEGYAPAPVANHHPTVKPTDLMRYLCRLVTPAGGVVLDPFMGSGSTGKAARIEGFDFIGCELDESYFAIAQARCA